MFKKIILAILVIGIIVWVCPSVDAGAVTKGGMSYLIQESTDTKLGYIIGINVPLIRDTTKSIEFSNETDILYVKKRLEDVNELTVIRSFFMTTKYLPAGFYIKMGSGGWKIINSLGEDLDSFALRFGGGWKATWGIKVSLELDIVRVKGPDLYAPNLTLTLLEI